MLDLACNMVSPSCLWNPQDDSDEEAVCTKRAAPRKRHRNLDNSYAESLIEFSCEEGEETASSEVKASFRSFDSFLLRVINR